MGSSIVNRSSEAHEKLTEEERHFISGLAQGYVTCPDCEQGGLLSGPSGGMSQNVMCENCESEFNLTFVGEQCIFAERISNAGPRDAGDRKGLYSGYFGRQ
jgi:hypothetical protein